MYGTRLPYAWYIPATLVLALQLSVLFVSLLRSEGWSEASGMTVGLLSLVTLLIAGVRLVEGLQWHASLACYISVVAVILAVVRRAILPLLGLLFFFVVGVFWGGDHGAVFGILVYGYLALLGYLIVDDYEVDYVFPAQVKELFENLLDRSDEMADRYLFSPVLLWISAISRCLPFRSRKFFRYTEQALLMKRSAGDIEFMHRLLRDYFALRDLQPLLIATDPSRRLQAIRSLGFQGDAAMDALAEFVRNADPDVREAAAWALGRVVSPATVPHVEAAINDSVPKVRRAAVLSTKNFIARERNRLLEIVVDDTDLSVQGAVLEVALGSMWSSDPLYIRIFSNVTRRQEMRQIVFDLAGDNKTHRTLRAGAVDMLGDLKDPNSIPYLINAMMDHDFFHHDEAARILGKFDDPEAVRALIKARSLRNKRLRIAATESLLEIQSRGVLQFKF